MSQIKALIPGWLDTNLPYTYLEKLLTLSDEALCKEAQGGCVVSQDLLWQRFQGIVQLIVYKQNRQQCLPPPEMADALQELYFAFHEAIKRYDPQCHSNGKPASFKTFLRVVVARSFSNYCRQWRRYHQHVALNLFNELPPSLIEGVIENQYFVTYFTAGSDCSFAVWQKIIWAEVSSDRLAKALSRLKLKEIRLLVTWLQCRGDREVAQALGISTSAAKLLRERFFRRIKQSLADKK